MANLQELIPAFFTGPNGEPLSPEQIKQRQSVAASLMQQATDTSPNAGGWASILAKGVQGGIAGYKNNQAERAETANTEYNSGLLGSLFSGQAPAAATPAYPSSVASGGSSMAPAALGAGAVDPATLKAGLIQRGLPEQVADGFLMNFADESGFNPGINEQNPTVAGSRGGFGLYQLTGPRRKAYESFASSRGLPVDSPDAQMDFLVSELQGPEAGAAKKIFAAPDAGTAAAAIVNNFLRPAEEHRTARANKYVTRPRKYAGMGDDAPLMDAALSGEVAPMSNPTVAESLVMPAMGADQRQLAIASGAPQQAPIVDIAPSAAATPASLPGADQGIGGVAYEQVPPVMPNPNGINAAMPAGQPGEIRQGPDGKSYQYAETTGMAGDQGGSGWIPVNAGSPMAQPPADVSRVPALSGANGLPVVGPTGQPSVSAALSSPPPAPQVGSVAEALAIRPQADPNDRMVADAAHTLQPTAEELGGIAPQQAAAPQDQSMQLQRVLADPRASPQTKQVALGLLQQKQREAAQVQAAQVQQQNWLQQQEYEKQQQANDPLRQAQIRKSQLEADAMANPQAKPGFRQLSAQEAQGMGLDPSKQYQVGPDNKVSSIGDSGVNVEVNTGGNTNKFVEESDKAAATRFDGYVAGGRQAQQQISDMQTLADLGKQITTGKGAQVLLALGPYAESLGIKIDDLSPAQAYKSITDRLAPAMRVPGSGSSSDIDVRMFLNSLPNIGNSPEANNIINGTFQSIAQNKVQAADIAQMALRNEITWQEAEQQISALPNPYENFKKFKKDNPSMFGGDLTDTPAAPEPKKTSTGVQWSID